MVPRWGSIPNDTVHTYSGESIVEVQLSNEVVVHIEVPTLWSGFHGLGELCRLVPEVLVDYSQRVRIHWEGDPWTFRDACILANPMHICGIMRDAEHFAIATCFIGNSLCLQRVFCCLCGHSIVPLT